MIPDSVCSESNTATSTLANSGRRLSAAPTTRTLRGCWESESNQASSVSSFIDRPALRTNFNTRIGSSLTLISVVPRASAVIRERQTWYSVAVGWMRIVQSDLKYQFCFALHVLDYLDDPVVVRHLQ